jgi:O-antigen chain-terminating methyltransferase
MKFSERLANRVGADRKDVEHRWNDSMQVQEERRKYDLLLAEANTFKKQTGNRRIRSGGRLKKQKVFLKRLLRRWLHRILGWYLDPIYQRQTDFNKKVLEIVKLQNKMLNRRTRVIEDLIKNSEEIASTLGDLIRKHESHARTLDNLQNDYEALAHQFDEVKDFVIPSIKSAVDSDLSVIKNRLNLPGDLSVLQDAEPADYFEFEDRFRGTRRSVKDILLRYVGYYANRDHRVLDIGCGRGEFLELMKERGVDAYGIDVYGPFVEYCRNLGLDVLQEDALTYLNGLENDSLGGILMTHVIEYMDVDYAKLLLKAAYDKLSAGAYFILMTPNPESLITYSSFWLDEGHKWPVPFRRLNYHLEKAGFQSVLVDFIPETSPVQRLMEIEAASDVISNIDVFNRSVADVNGVVFGCMDYTLIAKK